MNELFTKKGLDSEDLLYLSEKYSISSSEYCDVFYYLEHFVDKEKEYDIHNWRYSW
jgi:hypothetical protein